MGENRATAIVWTNESDEMLIDFVKNNEALYNIKSKDYRKTQLKQNLCNGIGNTVKKSGVECCKRWTYIRDYYIRRRGKPGTGSGGEAAKKRSELLSFLDSTPSSQRSSITNVVGDDLEGSEITEHRRDDIEENTSDIDNTENMITFNLNDHDNNKSDGSKDEFMRAKKKKKISNSEERLHLLKEIAQRNTIPAQHELDETDMFFSSMAKIVKQLPRYEQIQLRMQISSLVGNAELRSLSNESRQTNESSTASATRNTSFPNNMISPITNETNPSQRQFYYVLDTTMTTLNESHQSNALSRPSSTPNTTSNGSEFLLTPASDQKRTLVLNNDGHICF